MRALQEYARKRDFKKTAEPIAKILKKSTAKTKKLIFVVQEHHASHLHYDFRLELDGVLKSWAVPKGPSTNPVDKRLAVQVEDHPLKYAKFTGTIPEGEYGAGEVYTWDAGTWEPLGEPHEAYKKGRLEFSLKGKKLKGTWLLIRTQRASGKKPQWLLMKRRDAEANLEAPLPKKAIRRETSVGDFIAPELATLVEQPPTGPEWLHEMKFDGYRFQAHLKRGQVQLLTRSRQEWSDKYPTILQALQKIAVKNAVLDGEIVVLDAKGRSDFQLLQNAMTNQDPTNLVFYVFDLLSLDGKDLQDLPLVERKKRLQKLLKPLKGNLVRFVEGLDVSGKDFLQASCEVGIEGIVSKKADSPYISGRHDDWVKSKCQRRQEFVIGGYTDPEGSRQEFGALLLGIYDDDQKLRYVGKVGTGFTHTSLRDVLKRLQKKALKDSPFAVHSPKMRGVHWVRPELAAEISFSNWTQDQILRVPVFHGLREDKAPQQIGIERPRSGLALTHPDKVLFKKEKITKQDIAEYYQKVSAYMLPEIEGRPLSLLRCPNGSEQTCFFQKHAKDETPSSLEPIRIREKNKTETSMAVSSEQGLLDLVQMGTLEIHVWNSRQNAKASIENPDQLVMDFDPGPEVPWKRVVAGAFELKKILEALNLKSFVKVTGGKGLHIHVPIAAIYSWDQIKDFTRTLALEMVSRTPELYLAEMSKKQRTAKIFLDYLRNSRGATAVAPYSLRAKPVSAVALPIEWEELKKLPAANYFTLARALKKIQQRKKDPWQGYEDLEQKISILKVKP